LKQHNQSYSLSILQIVNTDGPGLNLSCVKEFQGRTVLVSAVLKYLMVLKLLILSKEMQSSKSLQFWDIVLFISFIRHRFGELPLLKEWECM